jgi:hypothetical protein
MPKGLGRFQQKLLAELHLANRPLETRALIPGRSGSEKRRTLRKLAAEGLVHEVLPDTRQEPASPDGSLFCTAIHDE